MRPAVAIAVPANLFNESPQPTDPSSADCNWNCRSVRSESEAECDVGAPRGQAVILGVAELALGHGITTVAEIASVQPKFPAIQPVPGANVHGREGLGQGGIPLVEEAIPDVFDDDVADES